LFFGSFNGTSPPAHHNKFTF